MVICFEIWFLNDFGPMATPRDFLTVHSIVSVHSILRVLCALKHENCINYDFAHAHKWFLFPRRNMRRTPVNQPKIDKYAAVSIIQDWQWCMKHPSNHTILLKYKWICRIYSNLCDENSLCVVKNSARIIGFVVDKKVYWTLIYSMKIAWVWSKIPQE